MLDRTIREIKKYSNKNIKIAFDEWNTYVEATPPYFIENYNIADAIYAASLLNACINRGDIITNTGIYHLINVMGNYRIEKKKIWKTPTTLVLELYTKFHKGKILKSVVNSSNFVSFKLGKQPEYKNNKLIDSAVTMNGKHMCMSVVNKSSSEKILLKVPYLDRITENYCIEGSNKVDLNTYENTSRVKIKKNSLKTSKGFLILPPHSISVVLFNI